MGESFGEQLIPKEIPPAEKIEVGESEVEKEPEVEIDEKDRELSELALVAKEKADSVLNEALEERKGGNMREGLELERRAYRIFAALDVLGVKLPQSIRSTANRQIEKGNIAGFSSKKSAEIFLKEAT